MKTLNQLFTESATDIHVSEKDWLRMSDLIDKKSDGAYIAAKITDKNKAAARYIAGLKLTCSSCPEMFNNKVVSAPTNEFSIFGNKAISLGITIEDLKELYDKTALNVKFKPYTLYNKWINKYYEIAENLIKDNIKYFISDNLHVPENVNEDIKNCCKNDNIIPIEFSITCNADNKNMKFNFQFAVDSNAGFYGYLVNNKFESTYTEFKNTFLSLININESKGWIDEIDTKWTPKDGLFTLSDPKKIADYLIKNSKDKSQAMKRLTFYMNRAGDNLSNKTVLNKVKDILSS